MNLHLLNLNEIRGFGRKKPFLLVSFLMGALGIGGIPLWNGYVSKTLLHESIVEYIAHMGELGKSTILFQSVEWAFLVSGGLTVAYMLKIFVCLFVEKHPERQGEFDSKTDYMSPLSKTVIGLAALLLPVMGMFPQITMNQLAEVAVGFFHGGHLEHEVEYFVWVNLKGGMVSIVIGILVYVFVIRKVFMKQEGGKAVYVDIWPYKVDVEKGFILLVKALLALMGWMSRWLDELPEKIVTLFQMQPSMNMKSVFAETTEPEENVLMNSLHKKLDERVEIGRIIGSSFSFGLLLACVGLLFTIVYLLIS